MSEKQGRHTGHRHMGHGPMHGMGAGEKAKDFKGTLKKLLHYLSMFKVQTVSYTHLDVYKRQGWNMDRGFKMCILG